MPSPSIESIESVTPSPSVVATALDRFMANHLRKGIRVEIAGPAVFHPPTPPAGATFRDFQSNTVVFREWPNPARTRGWWRLRLTLHGAVGFYSDSTSNSYRPAIVTAGYYYYWTESRGPDRGYIALNRSSTTTFRDLPGLAHFTLRHPKEPRHVDHVFTYPFPDTATDYVLVAYNTPVARLTPHAVGYNAYSLTSRPRLLSSHPNASLGEAARATAAAYIADRARRFAARDAASETAVYSASTDSEINPVVEAAEARREAASALHRTSRTLTVLLEGLPDLPAPLLTALDHHTHPDSFTGVASRVASACRSVASDQDLLDRAFAPGFAAPVPPSGPDGQ